MQRFRLIKKGLMAVMDEGLFSLSSFVASVSLARAVPPSEYGAFAAAFSTMTLVGLVYQSFVSEPMMVYGAIKDRSLLSPYLIWVDRIHWIITLACSGVLLAIAIVVFSAGYSPIAISMFGFALAAPGLWLINLRRRTAYVIIEPRVAAEAGIFNLILVVTGILFINLFLKQTMLNTALLLGLAGALASTYIRYRLRCNIDFSGKYGHSLWPAHRAYGRWSLAANAGGWIPSNVYFLIVPMFLNLSATGQLRAIINLLLPILHFFASISILLIPVFSRARRHKNFKGWVNRSLVGVIVIAVGYVMLLSVYGEWIMGFLYAQRYNYNPSWILPIGLYCICSAGNFIVVSTLRAIERPKLLVRGVLVAGLIVLGPGLYLTISYGVNGALYGLGLAQLMQVIVNHLNLRKELLGRQNYSSEKAIE